MAPSTDGWRRRAACRNTMIDMTPDPDDGEALRLAKKLCAQCPVKVKCLLASEALQRGGERARGVWAGLSEQERNTMAGLGRLPEPCSSCDLDCVPINLSTTQCASCRPTALVDFGDYRLLIETMVRDGKSYQEISDRLRLKKASLASACKRWKIKIGKRSANRPRANVKECGTLAAKYRHHRNIPYSWRDCPRCRLVPWNKAVAKVAA